MFRALIAEMTDYKLPRNFRTLAKDGEKESSNQNREKTASRPGRSEIQLSLHPLLHGASVSAGMILTDTSFRAPSSSSTFSPFPAYIFNNSGCRMSCISSNANTT